MFELYDIFDNNEINVILLIIVVIILIIVIVGLGIYDYTMKKKLIKVETKLKNISDKLDININNNNLLSDISKNNNNNNNNSYKEKYEDLLKEKDAKQSQSMQYSPSEYSTLLKYNPILPYSAFTMDIINNAYLDMNEQGMYEDKYFALSNYDNIYDQSDNNNNNNNSMKIEDTNLSAEDQETVSLASMNSAIKADKPQETNNSNNSTPPTTPNSQKTSNNF